MEQNNIRYLPVPSSLTPEQEKHWNNQEMYWKHQSVIAWKQLEYAQRQLENVQRILGKLPLEQGLEG